MAPNAVSCDSRSSAALAHDQASERHSDSSAAGPAARLLLRVGPYYRGRIPRRMKMVGHLVSAARWHLRPRQAACRDARPHAAEKGLACRRRASAPCATGTTAPGTTTAAPAVTT